MEEKVYTITCTEKQLRQINTCLEEYMRISLGQFNDLANRLSFKGFDYHDEKSKETFDARINARNACEKVFAAGMEVAQPDRYQNRDFMWKSEDELLTEDMWCIIKHVIWENREDKTSENYSVDSVLPFTYSKDIDGFAVDRK